MRPKVFEKVFNDTKQHVLTSKPKRMQPTSDFSKEIKIDVKTNHGIQLLKP